MKSDGQIKQDVLDELVFQPEVDETQIGVQVQEGVVTLTGIVDSYPKKYAARKAAKKVKGVRAIVEDLVVKHGKELKKTDQELARAAANFLEWNTAVHEAAITIEVRNGIIYLTGEVAWEYEKQAATRSLQNIEGVKGVVNDIKVAPVLNPVDIKEKISKAYRRSAHLDAEGIQVNVQGNSVELTGHVHSIAEKEEAANTAYLAPGVSKVHNKLVITKN